MTDAQVMALKIYRVSDGEREQLERLARLKRVVEHEVNPPARWEVHELTERRHRRIEIALMLSITLLAIGVPWLVFGVGVGVITLYCFPIVMMLAMNYPVKWMSPVVCEWVDGWARKRSGR